MTATADKPSRLDGLSAAVDRVAALIAGSCIGAMTLVVILGVFFRYVLNAPLNWAEEVSRYLMIWGASTAISLGVSAGEHVGLTIILDALKSRGPRRFMILLINLLVLSFIGLMFWYSLGMVRDARSQMTQSLGITMFLPRLAVPVAMALAAIQVVLTTLRALRAPDRRTEGPSYIDI